MIDLETFLEPIDQVQYKTDNGQQDFFILNKAGCKYLEDVEISYQEMFVDWSNAQIFILEAGKQNTNMQSALFHQQQVTATAKREAAILKKENEELRKTAELSLGKNKQLASTTEELKKVRKGFKLWRTIKDVGAAIGIAATGFLVGSSL